MLRSRQGSRPFVSSTMVVCGVVAVSFLWAHPLTHAATTGSCEALTSTRSRRIAVGLIGFGSVGKELVRQIDHRAPALAPGGLNVSIVAVARSRSMSLGGEADASLVARAVSMPTNLTKFGHFMDQQVGQKIIVDCSADEMPSELYSTWLAAGIHIVTPNKKLGSGPLIRYRSTFDALRSGAARFLYEATVGAGLPIITTLQDLLRTGDVVHKIEGILSGTLSFLFNQGVEKPFSEVLQDAAQRGFTEPDPRDDLSGLDVQRKTVILARECGLDLELADVYVESLVPEPLQAWQPSDTEKSAGIAKMFVEKMRAHDEEMALRMREAAAAGDVLRYVGIVDVEHGKASVGLRRFPRSHPFAATQWADNIVSFSTKRYTPRPLVVQGPGAGAAVTAGGVFADVLRVAGDPRML